MRPSSDVLDRETESAIKGWPLRFPASTMPAPLAFSPRSCSNGRAGIRHRFTTMNMQKALTTLGVAESTLTAAEKQQLDEQGYLPLPDLVPPAQVAALRARFQELIREEGDAAGLEVHQEAGTERLANLVDKDPLFHICFTHPRVLAGMNHVLQGDFKLSSLNGRASLPGEGHQPLHADWSDGVDPRNYQVCNSIWLLVDFTLENGATRIVPASHRIWASAATRARRSAGAPPRRAALDREGRHGRHLQFTSLARRHGQPHNVFALCPALIFHAPRQRPADELSSLGQRSDVGAPKPRGAFHSGCLNARQSIISLPLIRLHSAQRSWRLSSCDKPPLAMGIT